MELKTIFELPIYAMSQNEFEKRLNKKKAKMLNDFTNSGWEPKKAEIEIKYLNFPQSLWKYNQIIGYIRISVSTQDVWFDLACSREKKYYFDSKSKHFIENWMLSGYHFRICDNDTDDEIKGKIEKWVRSIEREHLHGRYIDFEQFHNLISYTNIKAMF